MTKNMNLILLNILILFKLCSSLKSVQDELPIEFDKCDVLMDTKLELQFHVESVSYAFRSDIWSNTKCLVDILKIGDDFGRLNLRLNQLERLKIKKKFLIVMTGKETNTSALEIKISEKRLTFEVYIHYEDSK